MAAYEVLWRLEINGESRHDAAAQAVTVMRERTGNVTVLVRTQEGDEAGPWEPVEVKGLS